MLMMFVGGELDSINPKDISLMKIRRNADNELFMLVAYMCLPGMIVPLYQGTVENCKRIHSLIPVACNYAPPPNDGAWYTNFAAARKELAAVAITFKE